MRIRYRYVVLSLLTVLTLGLSGGSPTAAAPATQGERFRLSVAMHWIVPAPSWSGILLGRERGYYDEEGIDLDLKLLRGSNVAIQTTGAGDSPMGIAGPESVLVGVGQGLPLTAVANHIQNDPTGAITKPDITTLADLRGRTVSTAHASAEPIMLRGALGRLGMDPERDVNFLYVDPQSKCTMLLAGQADACTGWSTFQLLQVQAEGFQANFIPFSTPEYPILGHVIFAHNDFLTSNPDVIRRFLRATMKGYMAADQDMEAAVQVLKRLDPASEESFLRQAVAASHAVMKSDRTAANGWGWMTDAAWRNLNDVLREGQMIDRSIDVTSIYTNDLLPENRHEWQ